MFIALFKFLKGYVKIRISGYSPERFMNLCSNHDILLWNIENHCDYYIMCISIPGFFQLKPFLKKTKTKVDVLERYGLPFFVPKLLKRKIFLIGLFGCIVSMFILSHFIWAISITGNNSITADVFMDYLKKQNIVYGISKKKVDIEQLEENIRKDYQNVTWASVRISGTKLEIMLKENEHIEADLQIAEKQNKSNVGYSNLIADKSGIITSVMIREGVAQVKKGDEVKKGDVLVKGEIPILAEDLTVKNYQYCEADADIFLQYTYHYRQEIKLPYQKKIFTGREKKIYFCEVGKNQLAFPILKNYFLQSDKITEKNQIKLFDNFYLPVFIGKTVVREYQIKEFLRSKEDAQTLLKEKFSKFLQTLAEKGVQIIEKNVKIENENKKIVLKGDLILIEQTGKVQEIIQSE